MLQIRASSITYYSLLITPRRGLFRARRAGRLSGLGVLADHRGAVLRDAARGHGRRSDQGRAAGWRAVAALRPVHPAREPHVHLAQSRKKSLPLDITSTEGQKIVHELIRDIDVVIVNYRPDVPYRCGIDYETLSG